jgi:integrase
MQGIQSWQGTGYMPDKAPLKDITIKAAIADQKRTGERVVKYDHGRTGLFLLIKPNSSVLWQYKYRFRGKEKQISLGAYPYVTLAQARDKHHAERSKLEAGLDPSSERKKEREVKTGANLFQTLAESWIDREVGVEEGTLKKHRYRMKKYVYPFIGSKPISEITRQDLLSVLRKVEEKGINDTAHRILQMCRAIWQEAVTEGKAPLDIASPLNRVINRPKKKSHAAIVDEKKLGQLLRDIDHYEGSPLTAGALTLLAMVFTRPGELRKMEWSEIDFQTGIWRIPAEKMKMDDHHIVPLSKQAMEVLQRLKVHSGEGKYVFPGREGKPVVSENTFNKALRSMNYTHDVHVAHGFRSTARTLLGELEYDHEAIELQLAHKRRGVNAAYNRATRMEYRIKMMQDWSDYLDKLKASVQ